MKDTIAFITVLTSCIYCHYFWTKGVELVTLELAGFEDYNERMCRYIISNIDNSRYSTNEKFALVWFYFHAFLSAILPYVVISTLLVTYCVKSRQDELTNDNSDVTQMPGTSRESVYLLQNIKRKRRSGQDAALTRKFVANVYPALCASYLLCTIPLFVLKSYDFIIFKHHHMVVELPYWKLLHSICRQLKTSFYAVKVVIYIISSQHVRNETGAFMTFLWKSLQHLCSYISCHGTSQSPRSNQNRRASDRAQRR